MYARPDKQARELTMTTSPAVKLRRPFNGVVVLNKANLRVLARYDSRHSNYHSDRDYARHSYPK